MKLAEARGDGIICVDRGLRPIFVNPAAERILSGDSPLRLTNAGVVTTRNPDSMRQVHVAVAHATGVAMRRPSFLALDRPERLPLEMAIDPLDGPEGAPLAVMILRDPDLHLNRQVGRAAGRFGYTAAESALAEALLRGLSATEYAETRGVSMATVRSQVRALLAKSGAARQAELVAQILRIPAL